MDKSHMNKSHMNKSHMDKDHTDRGQISESHMNSEPSAKVHIGLENTAAVAAVIVAAGLSSRMGEFKPLLKLGSITVVEHAVRSFFAAGVEQVTVVVGHRSGELAELIEKLGAGVVVNTIYRKGMFSSVQAGVATIPSNIRAFFLLPVDCPMIRAATIQRLCDVYESTEEGIIYPVFNGRRGHPPLISTWYIDKILKEEQASDGLRGLLSQHEAAAVDVAVDDEGVSFDMDTPSEYRCLCQYLQRIEERSSNEQKFG